jgi:hypothetical protein
MKGLLGLDTEKKVKEFLLSRDENFLDFIASLNPASPEEIIENSKKLKYFEEKEPYKIYMPNGIFKSVVEIDFIRFSYSLLKARAKDEKLRELIEIVEKLDQNDYKVKKFRVALFLSLRFVYSKFFDLDLYSEILKLMMSSLKAAKEHVEKKGKKVLSLGFDSVSFIGSKEEGEEICKELNGILEPKLKMKFYPKVIKFMNNSYYITESGEKILKRTTRTDNNYEKIKLEVLDCLEKEDFQKAAEVIKTSNISERLKKKYLAILSKVIRC